MEQFNTTKQGARNIYFIMMDEIENDFYALLNQKFTIEQLKRKAVNVYAREMEIEKWFHLYKLIDSKQKYKLAAKNNEVYNMIRACINILEVE